MFHITLRIWEIMPLGKLIFDGPCSIANSVKVVFDCGAPDMSGHAAPEKISINAYAIALNPAAVVSRGSSSLK